MKRMSMRRFAQVVRRVMKTMPPEIARHLDNVVVDVAEEPPPELLDSPDGESMYGLFEPMDLAMPDGVDFLDHPNRIWIFKRPLEEDFPEPRRLLIEIRKTVIHEVAHHFGWTDADLERFDDNPDPFGEEE